MGEVEVNKDYADEIDKLINKGKKKRHDPDFQAILFAFEPGNPCGNKLYGKPFPGLRITRLCHRGVIN